MKKVLLGMGLGVNAKVYFSDTFDNMDNWVQSKWKSVSEMAAFKLESGAVHADKDADKSLATTEDARFYAASASFEPFSNEDKTLIIQYQVKYDKDIECGGGYIKLGPKMEDPEKFGDPTPYNIMFGPDKCGYTKRTHLIFSTNEGAKNVLKKVDLPYKQETEKMSVLYRLVVKPSGEVEVFTNKESIYKGQLEEDWELLEPKEIEDPDDSKPDDWADDAQMDDPEDKKPEDWVEEAKITDPDAKQPEDWDNEEDGEWEAPKKDNPDYKGEWKAKRIPNPDYKGIWAPRKIPNPEHKENPKLYAYKEFGFVAFDLWQVKAQALFDNLLITDDEAEADKWAEKWETLSKKEKEVEEERKEEEKKAAEDKDAAEDSKDAAEDSKDDADKDVDVDTGDDDDEDL